MNRTDAHPRRRTLVLSVAALVGTAVLAPALPPAFGSDSASNSSGEADASSKGRSHSRPVDIDVLAPDRADNAGIGGKGWFVDLEIDFPGGPDGLAKAGFTHEQLTGGGAHNNIAPFPGTFSTGQDDRLPGLVVLTSTTNTTEPGFSGPGTNLANLFNLTGVTDRNARETEIWDTWIVGAPIAGQNIDTTLTVAVMADLNQDGVYNDAPDVVPDANHDGAVNAKDLAALGVASNIETVRFRINGAS